MSTDPSTGEITESEEAVDEAAIRSFPNLLVEHRYGQCSVEASEALAVVIAAVQATGKGGSVTVGFAVKPAGGKDRRILTITDTIKTKLPDPETESSIFYATDSNGLSREDPRQQRLPLAEVPKPEVRAGVDATEIREVN